jgi:hypothetical protein
MIHRNNSSGHVSATILGACIHGGVTFSRDDQRCATCWNSLEPHDGRTVVTSQESRLHERGGGWARSDRPVRGGSYSRREEWPTVVETLEISSGHILHDEPRHEGG